MSENDTATAAPAVANTTPPVAVETTTSAQAADTPKTKSKAKPAKKQKARRPIPMKDDEFAQKIIDCVYRLRKNNTTKWVDLRNSAKEGEELHKLLVNRPTYAWRKVGESWYLESKHDGNDTCVAYVLPHDPGAEYRKELREYHAAMQKRRSKSLKEPKKPASMKKAYRWVITSKRGAEEHDGQETNVETAKECIMRRQHLFAV